MKNLMLPVTLILVSNFAQASVPRSIDLAEIKNVVSRLPAQAVSQRLSRAKALAQAAEQHGLMASLYFNSASDPADGVLDAIVTRIVSDLSRGRVSPTNANLATKVEIAQKKFAYQSAASAYLNGSGSPEQLIASVVPKNRLYNEAVAVLNTLRSIKAQGNWATKPVGLELTLASKKAGSAALISYLRKKLQNFGYSNNTSGTSFDEELNRAVLDFQTDNALVADGLVGKASWALLDKSVDQLMTQASLNIDRTRWLPDSIPGEFIMVNLARQKFQMFQNNQEVLNFRSINGRMDRQTPLMIDVAKTIILNPTWTVPRNLFVKDKLAHLRQDPGYIANLHADLIDGNGNIVDPYSVDWNQDPKFLPYTIVQRPGGSWNALGYIKFPLTNAFAIYLHDTNERGLFAESDRLRSSGCVRLQKPFDLAEKLFDSPSYTADRVRGMTEGLSISPMKPTNLSTKRAVPVYLFYQTVSALNGKLLASNDPYEIDKLQYAAMISGK